MAREKAAYTMDVAPLPSREHVGLYDAVIHDFITNVLENKDAEHKSARVTLPGKQLKTVQVGLLKAARLSGRKDITVSIRNGEMWLLKKR